MSGKKTEGGVTTSKLLDTGGSLILKPGVVGSTTVLKVVSNVLQDKSTESKIDEMRNLTQTALIESLSARDDYKD